MSAKVYNIPAGVPFADALAAELLGRSAGAPEKLSSQRILLPTRRSCRVLRESFLRLSEGRPLLLPRLQPLGEVDEEELSLDLVGQNALSDLLPLPPAIPPLQRQILLARAVLAQKDFVQGADQALALADALGRLLDRVYTENLDIADLAGLASADFAQHWQITLDFLTILSRTWPEILKDMGCIDAADRRNRLLLILAESWDKAPPPFPIWAAGSTGSIPASARLLKTVAALPQGGVILPGLDQTMDEESWTALDDNHPQATLKQLLSRLQIGRDDVRPWPCAESGNAARRHLIQEALRPAATADKWSSLKLPQPEKKKIGAALENLIRCDCETSQEEARTIALLMREALETPGYTAALITPDRFLARRVAMLCRRWGFAVDDSGGQPLNHTGVGGFFLMVIAVITAQFSPVSLLTLLRSGLCAAGMDRDRILSAANVLDVNILRGPKPPPGIEGLKNRIAESRCHDKEKEKAKDIVQRLEAALMPLSDLAGNKTAPFTDWLQAHIKAAEALAASRSAPGAENLWTGDDGEAAALFLTQLGGFSAGLPDTDAETYQAIIGELMKNILVRPAYGTHPRLSILGQLEARMVQSDLVILGGLNEGVWPPAPGHDPWMSRPMMKDFGLPPPERGIGLAAHDFVQGFCAGRVALTRAARMNGTPTVPSRWLQRLDTVLQGLEIDAASPHEEGKRYIALGRLLDDNPVLQSCGRPAPTPPRALRPRRLSVTQIETWMKDPYAIYAREVLRLEKLEPLERRPDMADRGTFIHDVLKDFIKNCPDNLPGNARNILLDIGVNHPGRKADDPGFWDFWWPRFQRLADWFIDDESKGRQEARPVAVEISGLIKFSGPGGDFTLTARADRIDRFHDGRYAIIDYKSGTNFPVSKILSAEAPQLVLEALILQGGGFADLPAGSAARLGYKILTGGNPAGETRAAESGIETAVEEARMGLESLIRAFDDPQTPYYSVPDPDHAPRFNDYDHLARIQEWADLDDTAEAA